VTERRHGAAIASIGLGLGLALVAARLAPLPGPPLYDGVTQAEPYRWLVPPSADHPGNPSSGTATLAVTDNSSPLIAVATAEVPPQAQIFAPPGALDLPPGTTSITVSIAPVAPAAVPTAGNIDGNVYRISIVTQAGVPVVARGDSQTSIILEAPDPTTSSDTIALLKGGTWQPITTEPGDLGATFLAVVTDLGDFALITPGPAASGGESAPPAPSPQQSGTNPPSTPAPSGEGPPAVPAVTLYAGIAIAIVLLGLLAVAIFPRRRRPGRRAANRPPPRTRR
jgi:hypothetical protein